MKRQWKLSGERTRVSWRTPGAYFQIGTWCLALVIGISFPIGCSGSKSGDRPTRWSTVDQKSSHQKDK
jgi:hypothetical protein